MLLKKFLLGTTAMVISMVVTYLFLLFLNRPVNAWNTDTTHENGNVTICHATHSDTNPYVLETPNKSGNVGGHDNHANDIIPPFDYWVHHITWILLHYPGKNWTLDGQAILRNGCKVPESQPKIHLACVNNACVQVEGEGSNSCSVESDCLTIQPPVIASDSAQSSSNNSSSAPTCPDGSTTKVVANPHVVRKGSDATVNFFITEGNSANIYYKVVGQNDWQFSVIDVKPNSDNFVSYTVHNLDANVGYTFGIQQKIGCGGGQIVTAVIVDGPNSETFKLSYYVW